MKKPERKGSPEPYERLDWPKEDEVAPKPASRGRLLLLTLGHVVVIDLMAIAVWFLLGPIPGVVLFIFLSFVLARWLRWRLYVQSRKKGGNDG